MAQKKRSSPRTRKAAIGNDPFAEMQADDAGGHDDANEDDPSDVRVSMPSNEGKKTPEPAPVAASDETTGEEDSMTETKSEAASDEDSTVDGSKADESGTGDAGDGVVLPEVVMLPNVAEISDLIADALAKGEAFSIDAGALERVDTAGMQLLLAAVSQGRSQGLAVSLTNATDLLRQKAAILDLEKQLGLAES